MKWNGLCKNCNVPLILLFDEIDHPWTHIHYDIICREDDPDVAEASDGLLYVWEIRETKCTG